MTTRILYLNKNATSPVGLPTSARFRLVAPGGIRLDADHVTIAAGKVDEFVNMVDGGLYGANSNQDIATVVAVNGANVARFNPALAATPTGYTMGNFGFGGLNTGQYTMAGLWKVTDAFAGGKVRETIAAAYLTGTALTRAVLREDATGVPQGRAQRTGADAATVVALTNPVRIGGWTAAAVTFDWTNNLVTIYDLLGAEVVSGTIAGTSGAAPTDISAYRLGYIATANNDMFAGDLADYVHLPYVPTAPELLALKMHMQARANDLAS
ncbi:hypothetical protein [Mesorhizobium sp. M0859]|uniref:hypothetical protein n=1 Tax=Mesorhizobium sp. M0859 TaxID=2957014 RepID=UPI003337975A